MAWGFESLHPHHIDFKRLFRDAISLFDLCMPREFSPVDDGFVLVSGGGKADAGALRAAVTLGNAARHATYLPPARVWARRSRRARNTAKVWFEPVRSLHLNDQVKDNRCRAPPLITREAPPCSPKRAPSIPWYQGADRTQYGAASPPQTLAFNGEGVSGRTDGGVCVALSLVSRGYGNKAEEADVAWQEARIAKQINDFEGESPSPIPPLTVMS